MSFVINYMWIKSIVFFFVVIMTILFNTLPLPSVYNELQEMTIIQKKWVYDPTRYSYDNPDSNTGICIKQNRSRLYSWHEPSDKIHDFSKELFCSAKYKNILFIGDSTTHGMFMSLAFLLGVDYRLIVGLKVRFYTNVVLCGKNITFIRNDDLVEHPCFPKGKRICNPIYNEIEGKDMIIVNRGVHFAPTQNVINDINSFMTHVGMNQRLIYRTTVTGHPDCNHKNAPDDSYHPQFSKQQKQWHWDKMDDQNEVVVKYIQTHYPTVDILDVAPMSQLRGDMHIGGGDCLHYCLPGPVDHWNKMLLNMII